MTVHWSYWSWDVRLDQAQKLTRFAAPGVPAIIGGDLSSPWPDSPGHQNFEPAWDPRLADQRLQVVVQVQASTGSAP
jgi:hypothetical protein